jgi:hypothetical protein
MIVGDKKLYGSRTPRLPKINSIDRDENINMPKMTPSKKMNSRRNQRLDSNNSESSGDLFTSVRKRAATYEHLVTRDQILMNMKSS